jgi:hypothetical protein
MKRVQRVQILVHLIKSISGLRALLLGVRVKDMHLHRAEGVQFI